MSFVDTSKLTVIEPRPGWRGRAFDSFNLTFVHYEFDAGASVHEHAHRQEEVWQIIEGELEVCIGAETMRVGPRCVAIIPPDTPHSVRALSDGRAIVTDYPRREMS